MGTASHFADRATVDCFATLAMTYNTCLCHCEERSDEAISSRISDLFVRPRRLEDVGDPFGDGRVGVEEGFDEAAGIGVGEVAVGKLRESRGQGLRFFHFTKDEEVGLFFEMS